ncbi:hypothetical protein QYE76_045184 [Lolium multiflorum]|uniref:Uncharacterized protein n=1 Tax=Lolium multiflorum TaxID=4521 RepID=A0AAD8TKR6_LOLMU|nr:hypothetical protein QYE76_045184 [Lolium multiflorum]
MDTRGWPAEFSAYKVAKPTLNAYSRILAKRNPELRVNCAQSGYVRTDMTLNSGFLIAEEDAQHHQRPQPPAHGQDLITPAPPPKDPDAPKRGRGLPLKAKNCVVEAVTKSSCGRSVAKKAKVIMEAKLAPADLSGSTPA